MAEWLAGVLIATGLAFFVAGSVGLLRLPDLYARLHALTKADNVGLGLLSAGAMLLADGALAALKLVLVWILVLSASAASAHLIAQHARRRERAPWKP
jgi:multicomponent Na+:H+ antiporter subunit G